MLKRSYSVGDDMSGSPDLRDRVADDRGFFKKLQLVVPGLREYRKLEDIRAADELLRKQVFDKLDSAKNNLEALRKTMSDRGEFTTLTTIGSIISQLQQISGEVFHSQQGSAGISPNIRIGEDTLNKLYEYDYNFINNATEISSAVALATKDYAAGNTTAQAIGTKIGPMLDEFKQSWKTRLESVENVLVSK